MLGIPFLGVPHWYLDPTTADFFLALYMIHNMSAWIGTIFLLGFGLLYTIYASLHRIVPSRKHERCFSALQCLFAVSAFIATFGSYALSMMFIGSIFFLSWKLLSTLHRYADLKKCRRVLQICILLFVVFCY